MILKDHQNASFQVGILEANMMGLAAGLTIGGKNSIYRDFCFHLVAFMTKYISIAYSDKNVKSVLHMQD
jgi:transketolase